MWAPGQVTVGRVTARLREPGLGAGRSALGLRLGHALDHGDLRPPGVYPSAILIVRALPVAVHGEASPEGGVRLDPEWDRGAREALANLSRRACRPARGPVPAGADAVLFADESELLAALLLDVVAGVAGLRWWWRVIFRDRGVPTPASLTRLLVPRASHLPAALHALNAQGQVKPVLLALSPAEVPVLLESLAEAYELGGLSSLLRPSPSRPERPGREEGFPAGSSGPVFDRAPRDGSWPGPLAGDPPAPAGAPWEAFLPPGSIPAGLGLERELLLGVALSLYQRPATVRTPGFLQSLRAWCLDQTHPERPGRKAPGGLPAGSFENRTVPRDCSPSNPPTSPRVSEGPLPESPTAPPVGEISAGLREVPSVRAPHALLPASNTETERPRAEDRVFPGEVGGDDLAQTEETFPLAVEERAGDGPATTASSAETGVLPEGVGQERKSAPGTPSTKQPGGAEGVRTDLAGVFYLVNVLKALDLPGCFEPGWGLASQVGAWGVLELLARALLGGEHEARAADPVWGVLADLDGRPPRTLPGGSFRRCPDNRLPPSWEGLDCAAEAAHHDLPLNADLARWLRLALPYVCGHLRRRLRQEGGRPEELGRVLLVFPGRVFVTGTHVDVVMPLDAISLPVRRGGLDQDPGWVPDLGRVVLFHFE